MRHWIIALTLIFLALLAVDAYPGLRGGSGWQWAYDLSNNLPALIALALVLLAYLLGVWWLRRRDSPVWASLAWMTAGAALITVAVVGVRGDAGFLLFTRTVSPVQTGASRLAVDIMATEGVQPTLENWTDTMRRSLDLNLIHFTTSPPGQPLLHFALADTTDNSAIAESLSMALRPYQCSDPDVMAYTRGELLSTVLGMMMPLWAALGVFPLYIAARDLTASRETALKISAWWALFPTVALFSPTWNSLYPALCVAVFALLLRGLLRGDGWAFRLYCFAAGLVMSITTFLNFAVLPALMIFGVFTLGYALIQRRGWLWAVQAGVWFGIGLSVVWVGYALASGLTPLDLLPVTFEKHGTLVEREYLPWLILHPYDTLLFIGWALVGLFIWAAWRTLKSLHVWRELSPLHLLVIATLATLITVNLLGIVQGENGRILSFYAPFVLLSAAAIIHTQGRNWDMPLLGTQALTVLVMAAALHVVPLDLNPPPQSPRADVPIIDYLDPIPVEATFDGGDYAGEFALDGHRFVADLGNQVITLETIWRGISRTERPYAFEVVGYAENEQDGEIITELHRWLPQNGNYLTTCWQDGDIIHDVQIIPLPPVSMPVVWTLELRAIDPRTGHIAGTTTLGPVNYP